MKNNERLSVLLNLAVFHLENYVILVFGTDTCFFGGGGQLGKFSMMVYWPSMYDVRYS